jgi:hypothetical protein
MYTLFDFVTQIKGAEYLIAVVAIGLFLLLWEALKPEPFRSMIETARDDLRHIGATGGYGGVFRTAGRVVAAPFIGLAYIIALPFVFLFALNLVILEAVARAIDVVALWMARAIAANTSTLAKTVRVALPFGWRPQMAYFLGRRKKKQPAADGKE